MTEQHPQFFTATILEWKPLLKQDKYKQVITDSLHYLVKAQRVKIFAFVIMPNHMHILWQIQYPHSREDVQRDLLKYTGQQILFDLKANHPAVLARFYAGAKDRKYQIWERNALSVDLYHHKQFLQKLEYIHNNPLQPRWNLGTLPEEYIFSSAAFYETGSKDFDFLTHYAE